MNKEFWNQRYQEEQSVYGNEPNDYFRQKLDLLAAGSILLPCEGEGRNALYAAKCGWDVQAFDQSDVAQQKSLQMAEEQKLHIRYEVSDVLSYHYAAEMFDVVALIYSHQAGDIRHTFHAHCIKTLKQGGYIILEGFSKQQIHYPSGGPKDIGMLYSIEEMLNDFGNLKMLELEEKRITLNEGAYHQGDASVIRLFAQKI